MSKGSTAIDGLSGSGSELFVSATPGCLGADARAKAEGRLRQLEAELEDLDVNVERLIARDDDDYGKWKTHAHQRRYEPPHAERLFDLEFVIA